MKVYRLNNNLSFNNQILNISKVVLMKEEIKQEQTYLEQTISIIENNLKESVLSFDKVAIDQVQDHLHNKDRKKYKQLLSLESHRILVGWI